MSRSTSNRGGDSARLRSGFLFLLALFTVSQALAAERSAVPADNPLVVVKEFLSTVYPEVWSEATRLSAITDEWLKPPPWRSGFYTVRLERAERPGDYVMAGMSSTTTLCLEPEELTEALPRSAPLTLNPFLLVNGCEIPLRASPDVLWEGLFHFGGSGLKGFSVQGTLSRVRGRNLAIKREVDANPAWSDSQIAEALKRAGARYGPSDKDAFLSELSVQKYATFLLATKVQDVQFAFRHRPINERDTHLAMLSWAVHTERPIRRGRRWVCALGFEPFEGSLVSLGCGQEIVPSHPAASPPP